MEIEIEKCVCGEAPETTSQTVRCVNEQCELQLSIYAKTLLLAIHVWNNTMKIDDDLPS
jgi:hypothetical protein